ncbi:hypothetical protein G3I40_10070 [Streptomyces sp. SID14478]|uniref:hypothetical protein n=1 Tax=Streptomyces sp. SID14478 TaxID=2706073 RepID=UPI0013DAAB59|nr:hypothetical protein [Streptomyces sp. SID14478]NEB75569.1 hypothetical protein [Streptomyces sp. SID14478]
MDDANDQALTEPHARVLSALDDLLARYAARIEQKREAGLGDSQEMEQLLDEQQGLFADREGLPHMSGEQLVQVAAIYETRIETWMSDAPDPQ